MLASPDSPTPNGPYAEVIGDPIAHSKSPAIHGFWLEKLGIDAQYRALHVRPDALGEYLGARAADPHFRGCNVTVPHKLAVLGHVADPGGVGESLGAANIIVRDGGGQLVASNSDAAGFFAPIADRDWTGEHAIVIGAGGAARAVLFALKQAGIAKVTILNRNVLKASALLAHFGLAGHALALDARLPVDARLCVNTSVLGMVGQPPLDIDLAPLPDDAWVYDIVYAPLVTPLLAAAEARGLETIDGLDMLIGQAAVAFELFFGAAPPRDLDGDLRATLLA